MTTITAGWPKSWASASCEFALNRPALERQRQAAIATAQAALAAFEKEQAPKIAEEQRKKTEATAKLEADLKAYETTVLAKKMADWEKEKMPLDRQSLAGARAQGHERHQPLDLDQGSRMARSSSPGRNRNGVVTISAETDLTGITGLRLEVLTDSRLPNNGPGRATDGNFVLNELELTAAPKAEPQASQAGQARKRSGGLQPGRFRGRESHRRQPQRRRQRLGCLAGHRRDPLGDVRDQRARRRRGRHGADLQDASSSSKTCGRSAGSGCRSPAVPNRSA